jgi:hypothetical protein
MFRLTDMTIVPVANTSDGISKGSIPYYAKLDEDAVEHGRVGAYLDECFDPVRHSLLYTLGERYTELRFGVLERKDFHLLERLQRNVTAFPDFVIFSLQAGNHYPTTKMAGLDISDPE